MMLKSAASVVVFMIFLFFEGLSALPYIYKFSDLHHLVNLFGNFSQSFFCYDLSAPGIPFPSCAAPSRLPLRLGASLFC